MLAEAYDKGNPGYGMGNGRLRQSYLLANARMRANMIPAITAMLPIQKPTEIPT
jgi:hypothetical protein